MAEKTAYLTVIASIVSADNVATEEELQLVETLCEEAQLSESQKETVMNAARETSGTPLLTALDVLKKSNLRYSLVADLIGFAESDQHLAPEEKAEIAQIAKHLKLDKEQLEALGDYAKEAAVQKADIESGVAGQPQGILENSDLQNKLQKSGINLGSLAKGLLAFIGPLVVSKMVSRGLGGKAGGSRGGILGSLLGGLSGGRGLSGIGGFLSRLLK